MPKIYFVAKKLQCAGLPFALIRVMKTFGIAYKITARHAVYSFIICVTIFTLSMPTPGLGRTPAPLCILLFQHAPIINKVDAYLGGTLNSLEAMRGSNGFLKDTIQINSNAKRIKTVSPMTSPTNIALDLLIQTELGHSDPNAIKKIRKVLDTLETSRYHKDSGLFFSRYSPNLRLSVADASVSSIDNLHLALALWTIKENYPNTDIGLKASKIFERMNFSVYYNEATGLIGGNLKYNDGKWEKELYNFDHLGSEARALYSLGYALKLFKDHKLDESFVEKSIDVLDAEIYVSSHGDILKLWDGSAFQLFFPKIFINEELYSPKLKAMFISAGEHMISEGKRRGLTTPASHSAGRVGDQYNDKAGDRNLVSIKNGDITNPEYAERWDQTFSPYALMMAATSNPNKFIPIFHSLESIQTNNNKFYFENLGFMDGLHLNEQIKDQVVPMQISVNQGMMALSLLQIKSRDQMTPSGRSLFNNKEVRARLRFFYSKLEKKISGN